MLTTFVGKKITGVLSVLPENAYMFEDEMMDPFSVKTQRLKKIMGYGQRRRVKGSTTISEMFKYGLNHLFDNGKLKREEIGAIVVVTFSQDYLVPQISSILQGDLGLSDDVLCMDFLQGCAGYVMGLSQSFMILEHMTNKKVVLCTGEIFNRKARDDEPLSVGPQFGGDVANITIVENDESNEKIYYNFYVNGRDREALIIRSGGFKNPMTPEQIQSQTTNLPFTDFYMEGSMVFNYVQRDVPLLIQEIVKAAQVTIDDIDWFLFHQPNRFMLEKLAEKIGAPYEKMPMDIVEKFGNSDSGTIPVAMAEDAAQSLLTEKSLCCLSGFGAGLSMAAIIMKIGELDFCENIISDF